MNTLFVSIDLSTNQFRQRHGLVFSFRFDTNDFWVMSSNMGSTIASLTKSSVTIWASMRLFSRVNHNVFNNWRLLLSLIMSTKWASPAFSPSQIDRFDLEQMKWKISLRMVNYISFLLELKPFWIKSRRWIYLHLVSFYYSTNINMFLGNFKSSGVVISLEFNYWKVSCTFGVLLLVAHGIS